MEALRMTLALVLPWAAGSAAALAVAPRRDAIGVTVALGYGYFLGMLATVIGVLTVDAVTHSVSFEHAALAPAILLAVSAAAGVWRLPRAAKPEPKSKLSGGQRFLFWALLAWIGLRAVSLGIEVAVNPLYVWDAWAAWAPKARVWFEAGALTPFVDSSTWVHQRPLTAYTLESYAYPPGVPIIQLWMALAHGQWDESFINLPWLAAWAALGLAVYGQLRAWGTSALAALVLVYLLLTLPLLDTHTAWAGIADLWVAALFGLAAIAALRWARERDRGQAALALALGAGIVMIKLPGLVWALTLVPAMVVALAPRSWLAAGAAAGALAVVATVALVVVFPDLAPLDRLSEQLSATATEPRWKAFGAFGNNMFVLANWHLLWYALPAVMLLALPRLWRSRVHVAATVLLAEAAVFLVGIYVFTERAEWALDYTQLNRAVMHTSVFVVFYLGILWNDGVVGKAGNGVERAED